jgi:tRNA pseudouridine55 synthase
MHVVDGVLVIDKPEGLTSHDVVAVARRILRQPRVGHAGTLDPLATGVLVLACGRATRLMRFLSASDKTYEATILFGVSTDSYDVTGQVLTRSDARPSRDSLDRAVSTLTGEYLQQPPAFSARKVDGQRAYALARQRKPVELKATPVRVSGVEVLDYQNDRARVSLTCSAGFYVRSFAESLGQITGAGACLEALRRTRSGDFSLQDAVTLATLQGEASPERLLTPLERLLPSMPGLRLTDEGVQRVSHGRAVDPRHLTAAAGDWAGDGGWVRLLHPDGRLVALAEVGPHAGTLHPSIVMI